MVLRILAFALFSHSLLHADFSCKSVDQSFELKTTEFEVQLSYTKIAAPESMAAKMHKGTGLPKAKVEVHLTRKVNIAGREREACAQNAKSPLLLSCRFEEQPAAKLRISLVGSGETNDIDVSSFQLTTRVERTQYVTEKGLQTEEMLRFEGIANGPTLGGGSGVSLEFRASDCVKTAAY